MEIFWQMVVFVKGENRLNDSKQLSNPTVIAKNKTINQLINITKLLRNKK